MNSDSSVSREKAETQGPEMTQQEVELNRNPSSQSRKMPFTRVCVCVCVCGYYFSVTHSVPEAKLHGKEGKCHKKSQSPSQANTHDHPGICPCLVLAQGGGSRLSLFPRTLPCGVLCELWSCLLTAFLLYHMQNRGRGGDVIPGRAEWI